MRTEYEIKALIKSFEHEIKNIDNEIEGFSGLKYNNAMSIEYWEHEKELKVVSKLMLEWVLSDG